MQTAEPGIYAIGDIAMGYPQLAHAGAAEGILAVTHIASEADEADPRSTTR
jgi:dihydrolipoamide dehydrogenase